MQVYPSANENSINSSCLDSSMMEDAQSSLNYSNRQGCGSVISSVQVFLQTCSDSNFVFLLIVYSLSRNYPPPTFGSSPNLEAFALQASKNGVEDTDSALNAAPCFLR